MKRVLVTLMLCASLAACDDDEGRFVPDMLVVAQPDMGVSPLPPDMAIAAQQTRSTTMTGAEEVPPVATTATGTATVLIDASRTSISLTMTHTIPVAETNAAHIHVGPPGVAGPIIFPIVVGATVPSTVTMTFTAADLTPQPAVGVSTFEEAVNEILIGNTT